MTVLASSTDSLPATQPCSQWDDYEPEGTELSRLLLESKYEIGGDVRFTQAYPDLSFCSCLGVGVRQDLERRALWRAPDLFARDEPLEFIGFGSGECLQELIILSQLLHLGFSKLSVTLIDKNYRTDKKSPDQLRQFVEQELEKKVEVKAYDSLEAYTRERDRKVPAIVTMFDLDRFSGVYEIEGVEKRGKLLHFALNVLMSPGAFLDESLLVYNGSEPGQVDHLKTVTVKERRAYQIPQLFALNKEN